MKTVFLLVLLLTNCEKLSLIQLFYFNLWGRHQKFSRFFLWSNMNRWCSCIRSIGLVILKSQWMLIIDQWTFYLVNNMENKSFVIFFIFIQKNILQTQIIFSNCIHKNKLCLCSHRFSLHDFQAQIHQKDTSISHNKYPKLIDFSNHVRICL